MEIDVVYLAYLNKDAHYTLDVARNFLNTYKKFPSGIEHKFTIIAKNWTDKKSYKELCKLAEVNNANIIDLPNDGWDIGAYYRISELLTGDYALFLGSSTLIMCKDWLLKFYNAFKNDDRIQLVGAMGSLEPGWLMKFPNPHIRTCSFMLKRDLLLEYASKHKFPVTKDDTYEFEHGEDSITKFVINNGYKAVVVNNSGEIFEPNDWVHSKTFRYPNESKNILMDKLSAYYYACTPKIKLLSEKLSWGKPINGIINEEVRTHG